MSSAVSVFPPPPPASSSPNSETRRAPAAAATAAAAARRRQTATPNAAPAADSPPMPPPQNYPPAAPTLAQPGAKPPQLRPTIQIAAPEAEDAISEADNNNNDDDDDDVVSDVDDADDLVEGTDQPEDEQQPANTWNYEDEEDYVPPVPPEGSRLHPRVQEILWRNWLAKKEKLKAAQDKELRNAAQLVKKSGDAGGDSGGGDSGLPSKPFLDAPTPPTLVNERIHVLEEDDDEEVDDSEELSSDDDDVDDDDDDDDDENALDLGDVVPEDDPLPTDDIPTTQLKLSLKNAKIEAKQLHQQLTDTFHQLYALKEAEIDMEEILLKADFHPDLLKELHQIETKHDTYSLLALSKLEFSRSSAIETCLACSKMANDTFLDKRKQARALLSESLVWGAHGIQFEYLSGGRGGSGDSGGVVSGVVGSLSGGGGGLEASVPPLARRGKRKEMHDAIFRSSSVGANGFPDWIRQSVLKKKGRRNTAVSNGRRSSSHSGNNSSAGAVVPPTCDGLGRADVEDDIALLRVLTSAT